MKRRDFVGTAAWLALAGGMSALVARAQLPGSPASPSTSLSAQPAPAAASPRGEFHPLRRNVGYFTCRGGTMGWLCSPEAVAVVDTQFPETAALFLEHLPGRDGRRVDLVVNTHHHGDHTGGNPVFTPVSERIVAHRKVPLLQMRAAERAGNLHKQAFAKEFIDEAGSYALGDEVLRLRHLGAAHTAGDLVVHFEKANIVHLGDLVFNRVYPVMDRVGGCVVKNWILILERLLRECPADALYLYGHGARSFGVSGLREDLGVMRDYLSALVELVARGVAEGRSRDEVASLPNMPGFEDFHLPPGKGNRFPSNLLAVYDELTAPPVS